MGAIDRKARALMLGWLADAEARLHAARDGAAGAARASIDLHLMEVDARRVAIQDADPDYPMHPEAMRPWYRQMLRAYPDAPPSWDLRSGDVVVVLHRAAPRKKSLHASDTTPSEAAQEIFAVHAEKCEVVPIGAARSTRDGWRVDAPSPEEEQVHRAAQIGRWLADLPGPIFRSVERLLRQAGFRPSRSR